MKLDSDTRTGTDYFSNKFIRKIEAVFSVHPRKVMSSTRICESVDSSYTTLVDSKSTIVDFTESRLRAPISELPSTLP